MIEIEGILIPRVSIRVVMIFKNGNYAVFDEDGKQVPELQTGKWSENMHRILAMCDPHTVIWDERAIEWHDHLAQGGDAVVPVQ